VIEETILLLRLTDTIRGYSTYICFSENTPLFMPKPWACLHNDQHQFIYFCLSPVNIQPHSSINYNYNKIRLFVIISITLCTIWSIKSMIFFQISDFICDFSSVLSPVPLIVMEFTLLFYIHSLKT